MEFHDAILGEISFADREIERFVSDLLNSPEVLRLRQMRLVNFDAPILQDLATARRYSHSVGVCKIADLVGRQSNLGIEDRKILIAAALVHDVGILPFGHLVEAIIQRRDGKVSHEALFKQIVYGTYHVTNIYHQIIGGQSLQLAHIFDHWKVDKEKVIQLVCPKPGTGSPISSSVDLDNIDNVHRMAALLGWRGAVENAASLIAAVKLVGLNANLEVDPDGRSALLNWMEYRRRAYSLMIAHPSIVAYNALLSDIVEIGIESGIIKLEEWFRTDREVERELEASPRTQELFGQLTTGIAYRLVDYVWFLGSTPAPREDWVQVGSHISSLLPRLSGPSVKYFIWPDQRRVSRKVRIKWTSGESEEIGKNSVSLLVAIISKQKTTPVTLSSEEALVRWRTETKAIVTEAFPHWEARAINMKDFSRDCGVSSRANRAQFELF